MDKRLLRQVVTQGFITAGLVQEEPPDRRLVLPDECIERPFIMKDRHLCYECYVIETHNDYLFLNRLFIFRVRHVHLSIILLLFFRSRFFCLFILHIITLINIKIIYFLSRILPGLSYNGIS